MPPASEGDESSIGLARGERLFTLYMAAGGALCMRPTVWRKMMTALHPDRGGDVGVFQHVAALKQRLDAGERVELACPSSVYLPLAAEGTSPAAADILYHKLRVELQEAAAAIGSTALSMMSMMKETQSDGSFELGGEMM